MREQGALSRWVVPPEGLWPWAASWPAPAARRLGLFAAAYPALVPALAQEPRFVLQEIADGLPPPRRAADLAVQWAAVQAEFPAADLPERLARLVRRELLRIAYRELFADGNPLVETAREISDLADFSVQCATDEALAWGRERFGRLGPEGQPEARFCVLGMGKLGGRELNSGSDIDLIFFHDDVDDDERFEAAEVFGRIGARIVATLEQPTAAGSAYRVDMRLRPEGKNGPLVHSLSRAERYYETWGRSWERLALLRARPIAGDLPFGAELLCVLGPFVWRRSVDPSLPRELHRLLAQARSERGSAAPRDLKLGPGGIREVEFFAQSLCLVWGGREPALRVRPTLSAIRQLRAHGYVTDREARDLLDAYLILRSVEHRIQFATGEQTHDLPTEPDKLQRLAASFGMSDAADFDEWLQGARDAVHAHYARLVAEPTGAQASRGEAMLLRCAPALDDGDRERLARALEAEALDDADELAELWLLLSRRPDLPLGELSRARYPAFTEALVEALLDAADPHLAARRVAEFFSRLETPGVYAQLFERDVRVVRRFVSFAGGSQALGEQLVGHPELVDAVLFAQPEDPQQALPSAAALQQAYEHELSRARSEYGDSPEATVAATRRLKSDTTVRIGVRDLSDEVVPSEVARSLSALADVAVRAALRETSRAGLQMAVIALGKYGAEELSYGSDLDLFFVFAPVGDDDDRSEELAHRVATRTMRLLSTPHAEGPGYELDTRLRPSGNQGLLVTSEAAFARYHGVGVGAATAAAHGPGAHGWERQALLKARFVAGDEALGRRVEAFAEAIALGGAPPSVERVREMRLRMQREAQASMRAEGHAGAFDIKRGEGGLVDIEFLVQLLQMHHRVRGRATEPVLHELIAQGWLPRERGEQLLADYRYYRRLEQRLRIVSGRGDTLVLREGPQLRTLARRLGHFGDARKPEQALLERLQQLACDVRAAFDATLDELAALPHSR